jgi:hypothetical protein
MLCDVCYHTRTGCSGSLEFRYQITLDVCQVREDFLEKGHVSYDG